MGAQVGVHENMAAAMDASPFLVTGAAAALVLGATGSGHCALMCGPLACAAGATSSGRQRLHAATAWHLGRLSSYALTGAILGAVGHGLTQHSTTEAVRGALPWILAAGLVASALELGRRVPVLPWLGRATRAVGRLAARLSPSGRGLALGGITPLLPCGLLYGLFLAAAAAGSSRGGALLMGAFALGATPALVAVQGGSNALRRWPRAALVLRRSVPLLAAAVIVWRALHAGPPTGAPTCH